MYRVYKNWLSNRGAIKRIDRIYWPTNRKGTRIVDQSSPFPGRNTRRRNQELN